MSTASLINDALPPPTDPLGDASRRLSDRLVRSPFHKEPHYSSQNDPLTGAVEVIPFRDGIAIARRSKAMNQGGGPKNRKLHRDSRNQISRWR